MENYVRAGAIYKILKWAMRNAMQIPKLLNMGAQASDVMFKYQCKTFNLETDLHLEGYLDKDHYGNPEVECGFGYFFYNQLEHRDKPYENEADMRVALEAIKILHTLLDELNSRLAKTQASCVTERKEKA